MKIKKKLFSRIGRRKESTPPKPGEEGFDLPPPTAIKPGVPYSENEAEQSGYGSHFELLASGETPSPDATGETDAQESGYGLDLELLASDERQGAEPANVVDAPESGHAPAPESLAAPVSEEPPGEVGIPRGSEPLEGYGDGFDVLAVPEPADSPDAAEPPLKGEEAASGVTASDGEALESAPAILEESEPETIGDAAPAFEEAPDAAESVVGGYAPVAPEIPGDSGVRVIDDAVSEDDEPPAASIPDDSVDEAVPSHEPGPLEGYGDGFEALAVPEPVDSPDAADSDEEQDEAVSVVEEKVVEVTASDLAVPHEDEPGATPGVVSEHEDVTDVVENAVEAAASEPETSQESVAEAMVSEPETPRESEPEAVEAAADLPLEEPDEASEPPLQENGLLPLVRDARRVWRPGKGFSRSELREAGLSPAEAARLRIRVDKRRRNAHPMNVAALEKAKSGV